VSSWFRISAPLSRGPAGRSRLTPASSGVRMPAVRMPAARVPCGWQWEAGGSRAGTRFCAPAPGRGGGLRAAPPGALPLCRPRLFRWKGAHHEGRRQSERPETGFRLDKRELAPQAVVDGVAGRDESAGVDRLTPPCGSASDPDGRCTRTTLAAPVRLAVSHRSPRRTVPRHQPIIAGRKSMNLTGFKSATSTDGALKIPL